VPVDARDEGCSNRSRELRGDRYPGRYLDGFHDYQPVSETSMELVEHPAAEGELVVQEYVIPGFEDQAVRVG
jgi:hypothetical protein